MTHEGHNWSLHVGDCREWLRSLPDASVDAVVTDPPYELGFMGKRWDASGIAFQVEVWSEVLRVLKPGGHLLAFSGTRTSHRMVCAIEDAGFEVRDSVHWSYGSGFPKSLDVSKAIDAEAGAVREVVGEKAVSRIMRGSGDHVGGMVRTGAVPVTVPATVPATVWSGWGTALKPAHEPICVARKPLIGTVAANVQAFGTGGINVDACRVGTDLVSTRHTSFGGGDGWEKNRGTGESSTHSGRWPANFILTHSADCGDDCAPDCPVALLDAQSGEGVSVATTGRNGRDAGGVFSFNRDRDEERGHNDSGTASRFYPTFRWTEADAAPFYYCAKAATSERECGLDSMELVMVECDRLLEGDTWESAAPQVRLRVDTAQSAPRVIGVYGTETSAACEWNTYLFGSGQTGPFRQAVGFTISTATNSTIASRTLRWLIRSLTSACTAGAKSAPANGGSPAASAERGIPSLTITLAAMESPPGVEPAQSPTRLRISAGARANTHETVKPVALMRWLIRLVTPPGGLVIDPFVGSGTTGVAAMLESRRFAGAELSEDYARIAAARLTDATRQQDLFA